MDSSCLLLFSKITRGPYRCESDSSLLSQKYPNVQECPARTPSISQTRLPKLTHVSAHVLAVLRVFPPNFELKQYVASIQPTSKVRRRQSHGGDDKSALSKKHTDNYQMSLSRLKRHNLHTHDGALAGQEPNE